MQNQRSILGERLHVLAVDLMSCDVRDAAFDKRSASINFAMLLSLCVM